ncbi:hypothetical protein AHF37_09020 [Paragonimus kellicotti]|nr:hypothetical protein AHF37_09020 [Paragonimus kellicotti]
MFLYPEINLSQFLHSNKELQATAYCCTRSRPWEVGRISSRTVMCSSNLFPSGAACCVPSPDSGYIFCRCL